LSKREPKRVRPWKKSLSTVEAVEPTSDEPRMECLQQCLGTLSSENRELICSFIRVKKARRSGTGGN
jgi:hypothetical protein